MPKKWQVCNFLTNKVALVLLVVWVGWFTLVRFNLDYFVPPDKFGGYFIGTTDNYSQLLNTYTRHESMPFHPIYIFWLYFFITVVWLIFARGWKKIWTITFILATLFAYAVLVKVSVSDGTELKHLATFIGNNQTHHLFKEESLSSGADVYQEFLYVAICSEGRKNCVFRRIAFDIFINGKTVTWQKEAEMVNIFVEGILVFEYNLQDIAVPNDWLSFRSDELGLVFKYPPLSAQKVTSVATSPSTATLKIGEGKNATEKVIITKFSKQAVRSLEYDEKVSTHYVIDGSSKCLLHFPQRSNKFGHVLNKAECYTQEKTESGYILFNSEVFYFIPDNTLDVLTLEEKKWFLESIEMIDSEEIIDNQQFMRSFSLR